MRGFALIELDEGRRKIDEPNIVQVLEEKVKVIEGLGEKSEWPSGAAIVSPVRRIRRLYGEDHTPKYNLYVEIEAENKEQFEQIFQMMEKMKTLCHVDGYGG